MPTSTAGGRTGRAGSARLRAVAVHRVDPRHCAREAERRCGASVCRAAVAGPAGRAGEGRFRCGGRDSGGARDAGDRDRGHRGRDELEDAAVKAGVRGGRSGSVALGANRGASIPSATVGPLWPRPGTRRRALPCQWPKRASHNGLTLVSSQRILRVWRKTAVRRRSSIGRAADL